MCSPSAGRIIFGGYAQRQPPHPRISARHYAAPDRGVQRIGRALSRCSRSRAVFAVRTVGTRTAGSSGTTSRATPWTAPRPWSGTHATTIGRMHGSMTRTSAHAWTDACFPASPARSPPAPCSFSSPSSPSSPSSRASTPARAVCVTDGAAPASRASRRPRPNPRSWAISTLSASPMASQEHRRRFPGPRRFRVAPGGQIRGGGVPPRDHQGEESR